MDSKSPDAFRTISEVAEWLDVPTHVLRFWESRFTQVKPVKRAGGRRYYRPADIELLGGIKRLLHHDGLTIRGVQKILREEGVKHVASLSPNIDGPSAGAPAETPMAVDVPAIPPKGEVVNFVPDTDAPPPVPPVESEDALNRWPFIDEPEEATGNITAPELPLETPQDAETPVSDLSAEAARDTETAAPDLPLAVAQDTPEAESANPEAPESHPTNAVVAEHAAPETPKPPPPKAVGDLLSLLRSTPNEKIKPQADTLRPLVERLAALHGRMAQAD